MFRANYSEDNLKNIISYSMSYADVLRELGFSESSTKGSASYKILKKYINIYKIDINHFLSHAEHSKCNNSNLRDSGKRKKKSNEEIFMKGEAVSCTRDLKKRILKDNLLKYECSICKIQDWQNKKLSLQLDHISGDPSDHRIENLRFLCPNCHSQTDTYAGKKLRNQNHRYDKKCFDCGIEISRKSTTNKCMSCSSLDLNKYPTKINWLSLEELLEKLKTTNYTQLGKELGVTDNAIRKHILSEQKRIKAKQMLQLQQNLVLTSAP